MTLADDRYRTGLRLVTAVGRLLSSSLDYPRTLTGVAALVCPEHADGFRVEIVEDETLTTVARAGVQNGPEVAFALIARDRELGLLRLHRAVPFDAFELEVFEELALRIAVTVDSAQIYAREHHVADTLQRALLPERLPTVDGLTFDADYMPAVEEAIVGGDWFDAFALPDGRVAVAIGDVAGHGLGAAIVMGEVRQALRAAAVDPRSPAHVLERANLIVNMRQRPVMVTAAFGIIDPATKTLTYALAGHPAPALGLPGGESVTLPGNGIPLGITDRLDTRDWTITIPHGAILAFYTDGMIEWGRNAVEGERVLLGALAALAADAGAEPARGLVRQVFAHRKNTDDVAVLAVEREESHSTDFVFHFSAIPALVPIVRRALKRYGERIGLEGESLFALLTATGEAVANAVEHAYASEDPGIVRLRSTATERGLLITVEDEGRWRPAQRREERGRGVPIMRALMDGVEIRTEPSRTSVRMTLETPVRLPA